MNFGQLIEYNMKNILLKKSFTKYGEETISRPFIEIKIEYISGSIAKSFMQFVFIVCQVRAF